MRTQESKVTMKRQVSTPFKAFQKLPAELRLQIWRYMIPGPRVVQLVPSRLVKFSRMRLPVILHICKESRQEAFRAGITILSPRKNKNEAVLWFNTNIDMMFMSDDRRVGMNHSPGKKPGIWGWRRLGRSVREIRHLAVNSLRIFDGTEEEDLAMWKAKLPSLETVTYSTDWRSTTGRSQWPFELCRVVECDQELTVTSNSPLRQWLSGYDCSGPHASQNSTDVKSSARVFKCKERRESWEELGGFVMR